MKMHILALMIPCVLSVGCDEPTAPAGDALAERDYDPNYPKYEPEDYKTGCKYEIDVIYNDDYPNTPSDCMMKAALCVDNFVPQCANGDDFGCFQVYDHCDLSARTCLKQALEL